MPCCLSEADSRTDRVGQQGYAAACLCPARNQLPRQHIGGQFIVDDQLSAKHIPTDNGLGCQITVVVPLSPGPSSSDGRLVEQPGNHPSHPLGSGLGLAVARVGVAQGHGGLAVTEKAGDDG